MNKDKVDNNKFEEVFKIALHAFKYDMDQTLDWLNSPCPDLSNQIPIHLLDTASGLKVVIDKLELLAQR